MTPSSPTPPAGTPAQKRQPELPFTGLGLVAGIIISPMLVIYYFPKLFRLYHMVPLTRLGIIVVLLGIPVLLANEVYTTLKVAQVGGLLKDIVPATVDKVDPANEGKLVYLAGATSAEPMTDPDTRVTASAVRLVRTVEMYQWKEKKGKAATSDKPATSATYDRIWSEKPIDSKHFDDKSRENPPMTMLSKSLSPKALKLGAYGLSDPLASQIPASQSLEWTPERLAALPEAIRATAKVDGTRLNLGDPLAPRIGDVRISYSMAPAGNVSLLAQQHGNALQAYSNGAVQLEILRPGTVGPAELIGQAQSNMERFAWIGRALGFFIILGGFKLFFGRSGATVNIMQYVGNLFTLGQYALIFFLTSMTCLLIIAFAWGATHPGLGSVALLLAAAIMAFGIIMARRMPALYKAWSDAIVTEDTQEMEHSQSSDPSH